MAHIGVFCLPMQSHMSLFFALSQTLQNRGHHITFFAISDQQQKIQNAGFTFQLMEPDHVPIGTLGKLMSEMANSGNFASMRLQGKFDQIRYEGILEKGPSLVKQHGLDAMIVDQAEACSGSVAEVMNLPWVSVCSGLCLNSEADVPPFFTSWMPSSKLGKLRNRLAYVGMKVATKSIQDLINRYRQRWKLPLYNRMDDTFSPFAQICQQNREFDFARKKLPHSFHYVGPIRSSSKTIVNFPWERLDGRPLIYASLGTLVNRHKHLYRVIAAACDGLDAQLTLSLGGSGSPEEFHDLPGSPLVVAFAPQMELLARSSLMITHAGLNSTLESLSHGVPLVAVPITFEQPAIAARIRGTGVGDFITASQVTPARLRAKILQVLYTTNFRQAAQQFQEAIAKTDGCTKAADITEKVIHTKKPVLA